MDREKAEEIFDEVFSSECHAQKSFQEIVGEGYRILRKVALNRVDLNWVDEGDVRSLALSYLAASRFGFDSGRSIGRKERVKKKHLNHKDWRKSFHY